MRWSYDCWLLEESKLPGATLTTLQFNWNWYRAYLEDSTLLTPKTRRANDYWVSFYDITPCSARASANRLMHVYGPTPNSHAPCLLSLEGNYQLIFIDCIRVAYNKSVASRCDFSTEARFPSGSISGGDTPVLPMELRQPVRVDGGIIRKVFKGKKNGLQQ